MHHVHHENGGGGTAGPEPSERDQTTDYSRRSGLNACQRYGMLGRDGPRARRAAQEMSRYGILRQVGMNTEHAWMERERERERDTIHKAPVVETRDRPWPKARFRPNLGLTLNQIAMSQYNATRIETRTRQEDTRRDASYSTADLSFQPPPCICFFALRDAPARVAALLSAPFGLRLEQSLSLSPGSIPCPPRRVSWSPAPPPCDSLSVLQHNVSPPLPSRLRRPMGVRARRQKRIEQKTSRLVLGLVTEQTGQGRVPQLGAWQPSKDGSFPQAARCLAAAGTPAALHGVLSFMLSW